METQTYGPAQSGERVVLDRMLGMRAKPEPDPFVVLTPL